MMDPRQEELRTHLRGLGFDEVRFASTIDAINGDALKTWLRDGMHADMAWMERTAAKRLDPSMVVEGVKSIILLGVSYAEDPGSRAANPDRYRPACPMADPASSRR